MEEERFSRRFGHRPEDAEITIREGAPDEVRGAVLKMAEGDLGLSPKYLRDVLCTVLRKLPDQSNWSVYPNIWEECQNLIGECLWYKVYDFIEALYLGLKNSGNPEMATRWEELINEYFFEVGIGWQMIQGQLETRGPEAFAVSVDSARKTLEEGGFDTSRREIHEALRDLSRRPDPDLTGTIHHAMAALECTAREITGNPSATLGEILKRCSDLLPKPLDEAITKLWGYASETGRHLREGRTPRRSEAELIVGVASSCCTYLAGKIRDVR